MATYLLKEKPYRWTFIIGFVIFLNLHRVILYNWLHMKILIAVSESVVHNTLLFMAVAAITQMLAAYRPVKNRYVYVAFLTTVVSLIWLTAVYYILKACVGDEPSYMLWLADSMPIRFVLGWMLITGVGFVSFFMYELEEQRQVLARKEAAEKLSKEAELYKLRQQLQPHFLFNSLNSINALVSIRPEEARVMIQKLSDFLRGTLKKEDQLWIPLKEELVYLELYLDIEKVRFRHRLTTNVSYTDDVSNMQIPPMLLQPVVENAIKFGLYDTIDAITIEIKAWQENGMLVVSVSNPFDPSLQQQPYQGTGFGLNSIRRRLYLLFAQQGLLETKINDNLFTTFIKIPQLHDKNSSD
ncbi:GHKL domain-containing protein [Chitinophaga sp. SYP-B3965]|uniref:sensor histidine kinase n=1 Tax=Chitinophaga sp. SYP-B3965 TaxID=2663120 RepID=UPI001299E957|nr:GHKL domain-containing protein [Chitinophaga sp. SYP-B3965]